MKSLLQLLSMLLLLVVTHVTGESTKVAAQQVAAQQVAAQRVAVEEAQLAALQLKETISQQVVALWQDRRGLEENDTAVPVPTAAPYVSSYTCFALGDGSYYACIGPRPDYFDKGFPSSTLLAYICSVDLSLPNFQGAGILDYCLDTPYTIYASCIILVGGTDLCSGCTILPDGTVAYDCDEVVGNNQSLCSNRNDLGQCNRGHTPWFCTANPYSNNGQGYMCNPASVTADQTLQPAGELLPKVPSNTSNEMILFLYCDNPVFGRYTFDNCGSNSCLMGNLQEETCGICRLLQDKIKDVDDTLKKGKNFLAYDCSFAFPDMPCTSTDVEGICFDVSVQREQRLDSCVFPSEEEEESNDEGVWWKRSRVLMFIDARTFNVVSDLVASAFLAVFGICIAIAYPLLMSWHLQRPNSKGTPVTALDAINGGLLASSGAVFLTKAAMPTVVLFVFLTLAEVSHPLSDVGFEPVSRNVKGSNAPVLSLRTEHRNADRPMETMGDPLGLRSFVSREVNGLDPNRSIPILPLQGESPEVNAYMAAVQLVATGGSPFTTIFDGTRTSATFGGLDDFSIRVGIPCGGDSITSPLASIPLEIPVSSCWQGVDSMNPIPQILTGVILFDDPLRHVARVPNCSLTGTRDTGIFTDSGPVETAQIVEFAFSDRFSDVLLPSLPIDLIVNGSLTKTFNATPEDKMLALDRTDWKQGRYVQGIDGVQVGNLTIGFSTVILASGPPNPKIQSIPGEDETHVRFFARVNDTCPDRPSGNPVTSDTACFVFLEMLCEPFREDSDVSTSLEFITGETSRCRMTGFRIVWGTNFVVDDQLLATLAGLFGVIQPHTFGNLIGPFNINGVLAAIFALGSLVERPSVKQVIVPRVSLLYFFAMILPLLLSLCCLMLLPLLSSKKLNIPSTAYELMVFGRETSKIKPRRSKYDKFPKSDLRLFYGPCDSENGSNALVVVGEVGAKASALHCSAVLEVPVPSEELSAALALPTKPSETRNEEPTNPNSQLETDEWAEA